MATVGEMESLLYVVVLVVGFLFANKCPRKKKKANVSLRAKMVSTKQNEAP